MQLNPGANCGCCGEIEECTVMVCVTGCPDVPEIVGAIITIDGKPPCTTLANGCCVINIGPPGTYSLSVEADGYIPWRGVKDMACSQTFHIKLVPTGTPATILFLVSGCCGAPVPNAVIRISDGQSCTTDATGTCKIWLAQGDTYTFTITAERYDSVSDEFTTDDCPAFPGQIARGLTPASGYICAFNAPYPVPLNLHYSDSTYGGIGISYPGTLSPNAFEGTGSASVAAGCGCPAATTAMAVSVDRGNRGCTTAIIEVNFDANVATSCPQGGGLGSVGSFAGPPTLSPTFPLILTATIGQCGPGPPSNGYPLVNALVTITE